MKEKEPQKDHLFRLHPQTQLSLSGAELVLNYGLEKVSIQKVLEWIDAFQEGPWSHLELSDGDGEERSIDHLRVYRTETPERSLALLTLMRGLRNQVMFRLEIEHHEEMQRYVRLWIWTLFQEEELRNLLEDKKQSKEMQNYEQVQKILPLIALQIGNLFNRVDLPMSFKDYKSLASEIQKLLEVEMEGLEPALLNYFWRRLGSKSSPKPSLLMNIQKRTHKRPKSA